MALFAAVAALAASWLASAWTLMIGVGIIHLNWIPALPTIGYKLSLLLSGLLVIRIMVGVLLTAVLKDAG